jgi:hypothetical protein
VRNRAKNGKNREDSARFVHTADVAQHNLSVLFCCKTRLVRLSKKAHLCGMQLVNRRKQQEK